MKIYARIVDGVVVEIIDPLLDPDGREFSISERFHPDISKQMIEVKDTKISSIGDRIK